MAYPPANAPDRATGEVIAAAHINALDTAIQDVVAEMGAGPKGSAADLTARLSALDSVVALKALADASNISASTWRTALGLVLGTDIYSKAATDALLAALSGTYGVVNGYGYNVLNSGDPLRDAIADGTAHPLSERFANLAAAQAKFPRAGALTEQIDRHAIQYGLDNFSLVVAPAGSGEYIVDSTVFTADGTYRAAGNQTFICDGIIKAANGVAPAIWLASGTSRGVANLVNSTAAQMPACDNLTIRVRKIDGNKANKGAGGDTYGAYFGHCNHLDLDLRVDNIAGSGVVLYGVNDAYTEGATLRRVRATACDGQYGVQVSLRQRKVTYLDVKAWSNVQSGVFVDHSESHTVSIQAWDNGHTGIYLHNFSRNLLNGLRATGNTGHGILVGGATYSTGGGWHASNNGQGGTTYNDIHFDATVGSYGKTQKSRFTNLECGNYPAEAAAAAGYALYVDDGVTDDVEIVGVKILANEVTGDVRVPASAGKLTVQASAAGTSFPKFRCGGDRCYVRKSADGTAVNNSTVLASDPELLFAVNSGEEWVVDFSLKVTGADTTADFKVGVSTPAGSTGDMWMIVGGALAVTGGSGSELFGAVSIATTMSVGAFASTNAVVVRMRIVAGADGTVTLQWAQNTATVSDLKVSAGSILEARRVA